MGFFGLGAVVSNAFPPVKKTPWWETALKGVGDLASAYAESASRTTTPTPSISYSPVTTPFMQKKDNTILFVGIGAVAIIGILIAMK